MPRQVRAGRLAGEKASSQAQRTWTSITDGAAPPDDTFISRDSPEARMFAERCSTGDQGCWR
jgi:hypothetical protein